MPAEVFYTATNSPKPVVIFAHGFKGYKDWGPWNAMVPHFVKAGFVFVKFNFSHNGGTVEDPIDFPDLEAFGNNNYSKELDDLGAVLDALEQHEMPRQEMNLNRIFLIGHSRGGGIVLLKANEDQRVKKVTTWAGVSDYAGRFPQGELLQQWERDGVYHIVNGRTQQNMPLYYQFYEDFVTHRQRLDIPNAAKQLTIPTLVIHGTNDMAVNVEEAENLKQWNPAFELLLIEGAGHTFGGKHPWEETALPTDLQQVVEATVNFFSG